MSSPVTAPGIAPGGSTATPARHFTEPFRQLGAFALLVANAVLLFLGFSGLIFVIDGWADGFGARSAAQFGAFVGPLALGLPFVAMLLATHVPPMVPRSRMILLTVLVQYGVSAAFGVVTFLGAFAHDLGSVRATVEGLLGRSVWLGLLVLAGIVVARVLTGLYPPPPPRRYPYSAPVYGRPYPGQPVYPNANPPAPVPGLTTAVPPTPVVVEQPTVVVEQPTVKVEAPTSAGQPNYDDALFESPSTEGGWPVVPPPPMPAPLTIPSPPGPPLPEPDPTVRVTPLTASLNGEATRLMPLTPPAGGVSSADGAPKADDPDGAAEPPTRDSGH
jgi:hypothetical protein